MKVATFNANSIRSRLDTILTWLDTHQPDVLGIQETKVADDAFPRAPFIDAGYHVEYRGQKSYNGVAIITREQAREVDAGFGDGAMDDVPRLLRAKVGDVHIVNTYVPQGREIEHEMYSYKCRWFGRLRAYFDHNFSIDDPVIWLGDMNVAHDPIDVHNPEKRKNHVCYHVAARDAFTQCREWGFVDVFRRHHPEPGQFTFFDYRTIDAAREGKGWRIDYILTNPGLAGQCTDSYIDMEPRLQAKPSDHTFLVAEFNI